MSHLDHVAISTADYAVSLAFYEKALAPLGIKTHMKFEGEEGNVAGLGSDSPARPPPALPRDLLRGLCPGSGRPQYRGGLSCPRVRRSC